MTTHEEFNAAEALFAQNAYDAAAEIYVKLCRTKTGFEPYCNYRLAAISNNTGDPQTAYDLYYKAFSEKPDIASAIHQENHTSRKYVFKGKKDEKESTQCPLCGNESLQPKWCYPLTEAQGYNNFFNPVRLWMYCEKCHHMVAKHFPEKLFLYNDNPRSPSTDFFGYYSTVLDRIGRYSSGMRLFEVGIGACECLLAAVEIGYDAFGIDVIDKHVQMAREKYGLNAQTADFVEFQSDVEYDVLIMGDVLEHVSDPIAAINKAHELLCEDGALWISTPNFDSAYSIVAGHNDPMKRQQYHLNYFSRHSLYLLLDMCGFAPVDYCISNHYNGSMEVIAVKQSRL